MKGPCSIAILNDRRIQEGICHPLLTYVFRGSVSRYYIPPQYFPFLKKLGDDTPELKHLDFRAFMCLLVAVAGLELDTPQ